MEPTIVVKVSGKRTDKMFINRTGFAYLKKNFHSPVNFSDIIRIELEHPDLPGERINYTPSHISTNYDKLFQVIEVDKLLEIKMM